MDSPSQPLPVLPYATYVANSRPIARPMARLIVVFATLRAVAALPLFARGVVGGYYMGPYGIGWLMPAVVVVDAVVAAILGVIALGFLCRGRLVRWWMMPAAWTLLLAQPIGMAALLFVPSYIYRRFFTIADVAGDIAGLSVLPVLALLLARETRGSRTALDDISPGAPCLRAVLWLAAVVGVCHLVLMWQLAARLGLAKLPLLMSSPFFVPFLISEEVFSHICAMLLAVTAMIALLTGTRRIAFTAAWLEIAAIVVTLAGTLTYGPNFRQALSLRDKPWMSEQLSPLLLPLALIILLWPRRTSVSPE